MAFNKVHFSSMTDEWNTPQSLFNQLDEEFHFDSDPCPVATNTIHKKDMLGSDWGNVCFVNPPYSNLVHWMKKAHKEWKKGKTVVMLIPSRTDTKWWHEYVMKADEIRFLRGRLKFSGHKNSAPFPSAIVVFKKDLKGGSETVPVLRRREGTEE